MIAPGSADYQQQADSNGNGGMNNFGNAPSNGGFPQNNN